MTTEAHALRLKQEFAVSTLLLIILSIITSGVYNIYYLVKGRKLFNEITESDGINKNILFQYTIVVGLLNFTNMALIQSARNRLIAAANFCDDISILFGILSAVYIIIIAFKMRTALINYGLNTLRVDLNVNAFLTFFFSLYYINYKINSIEQTMYRMSIISGQQQAEAEDQ